MGRTIPTFRILIDTEKSNWRYFRKYLDHKDKKIFNILFHIPKLHCHSLSNLSKLITIEPIIMINLFHNFKILKTTLKTSTVTKTIIIKKDENNFEQKTKIEFQIVKSIQLRQYKKEEEEESAEKDDNDNSNDQPIKDWSKFLDCLNNDDKNVFIEMINDCYNNYNKSINANIKEKDADNSCLTRTISLFMALILHQQKQIKLIKTNQRSID